MNIVEWRKLGEALERDADQSDPFGGNHEVLVAAARRDYDRYQECGECGGGGVRGTFSHVDQGTGEHLGNQDIPCPSCGGTGLQPNQARLEAGLSEIPIHYDDEWAQDIYSHEERMEFFAAAIRAFDKETDSE